MLPCRFNGPTEVVVCCYCCLFSVAACLLQAIAEPKFAKLYAKLCEKLSTLVIDLLDIFCRTVLLGFRCHCDVFVQ